MREVGLLDERVGPYRVHQLALREHAAVALGEHDQQVDGFWRERHDLPAAPEQPFDAVQPERPEVEEVVNLLATYGNRDVA